MNEEDGELLLSQPTTLDGLIELVIEWKINRLEIIPVLEKEVAKLAQLSKKVI